MSRKRPETLLGAAYTEDPAAARDMVQKALIASHGNVRLAAESLRVSEPFFQWVIRRLNMHGEPERWRQFYRRRYGLAP